MMEMYKPKANSPELITQGELNTTAEQVTVSDASAYRMEDLPIPMTLGEGEGAETVLVTGITGNLLTMERAFQGEARIWPSGTAMARYFTAYDQEAIQENLAELDNKKALKTNVLEKDNTTAYTPTADYHPATKKYADDLAEGRYSKTAGATAGNFAAFGADSQLADSGKGPEDFAGAEDLSFHTGNGSIHTSAEEKAAWYGKADSIPDSALTVTAATAALSESASYQYGELTSLALTGAKPVDTAYYAYRISFTSGTSPTTLTVPEGWVFSGDGCADGVFAPEASTEYEMIGVWSGSNLRWVVKAW